MKQIVILVLGVILVIGCEIPDAGYQIPEEIEIVKAPGQPRHPYQDEYEQMLYPTVRITAGWSTGTGVIAATDYTDGHRWIQIITAAHVVENQAVADIELYTLETITGTVVITDTIKDIALITAEINTDSKTKIYTAKLAPEDYTPYIFTPVYTVGCSLGLNPRPSQGIISVVDKDHWEITAPILPGNSGGPVFDGRTYEVIGIAVWVKVYDSQLITTMAGLVPINEIYRFLDDYEQISKSGDANR